MHGPLYGIDGNHRLVAQFLSSKGFDEVPVYDCTHAKMLEWAYVTDAARAWDKRKQQSGRQVDSITHRYSKGDGMATRPSIAASLFDEVFAHPGHADSVAYLRAMVNSNPPTVETEHLDFKSASLNGAPIPDGDVKKAWSEALAGFATTGGGVLFWGINARKPAGGAVDQATDFKLVIDPNGLKSRLQQLHHQSTDPPVLGVKIEALPDPGANGQGFVVCYIPESDYKPHRSEAANKRWVIRAGDSFVDASPPVLRSLFFPQRRSYIFLRCGVRSEYTAGAGRKIETKSTFEFRLYNEGPATAENLLLQFRRVRGITFTAPQSWTNANTVTGWRLHYPEPVHPGDFIQICNATTRFPLQAPGRNAVIQPTETEFVVQVFATDQLPQECRLLFSPESIIGSKTVEGLPVPVPTDRYRD